MKFTAAPVVPAAAEAVTGASRTEPEAQSPPVSRQRGPGRRETAESMAARQREISISEFFTKNRHLLGFDNPQKALLTAIKEAVDNSLDACEEAGILPILKIEIQQLAEDRFRIAVEDNGPGIVKAQIPKIFGKLLYGSKFHTLKQARGQQGIGISAAGMYGLLTTGKSIVVIFAHGPGKPAHYYEIQIDTRKNAPQIIIDKVVEWEPPHGTRVEIELIGTYKKGRHSVDDYIRQTAIANPHCEIFYTFPGGERHSAFSAGSDVAAPGAARDQAASLRRGAGRAHQDDEGDPARATERRAAAGFFARERARCGGDLQGRAALRPNANPHSIAVHEAERLYKAINSVKIMSPPTNCLSPIGEEQILSGLKKEIEAAFLYGDYARARRLSGQSVPGGSRAWPTEASLPGEELVDLLRFANRVPLQYQQSACAITKAVLGIDWRSYGLSQSKGALPDGPDGTVRPHRFRLGAFHLGEQGSHCRLPGDHERTAAGACRSAGASWQLTSGRTGAQWKRRRKNRTLKNTSRTSESRCAKSSGFSEKAEKDVVSDAEGRPRAQPVQGTVAGVTA